MGLLESGNISEIEKKLTGYIEFKKDNTFELKYQLKISKDKKSNPTFALNGTYLSSGDFRYKLVVQNYQKELRLNPNAVVVLEENARGYRIVLEIIFSNVSFKRVFMAVK